ncbi:hypothetical protein ACWIGH_28055 [Streptomyces albidoflavus]
MPLRSTTAEMTCAASAAGRCPASAPPNRPMGVRSGEQTTMSSGDAAGVRGRHLAEVLAERLEGA